MTEQRTGHRINGQMIFDSGWEWGYWLNAAVAARAGWDPLLEVADEWDAFAESLKCVTKLFPVDIGKELEIILVELTKTQSELLINGIVDGQASANINKLSGLPYLSGSDTWVDVPRLFGVVLTQPDKVRMFETEDENWVHVAPLLIAMELAFTDSSNAMSLLRTRFMQLDGGNTCDEIPETMQNCQIDSTLQSGPLGILIEFNDALKLLALRAKQVRMLYEGSDPKSTHDRKALLLTESRKTIVEAQNVVHSREEAYRVPVERIGAWRENPTVYRFSYLWAVHSLYYWWRDQGLAERGSTQSHYSPCYMNRMDASEVAVGWGKYTLELLRTLIHYYSPDHSRNLVEFVNCIAAPENEYSFPRDLYVY